jgi:hypothetical protein
MKRLALLLLGLVMLVNLGFASGVRRPRTRSVRKTYTIHKHPRRHGR